MRGESGLKTDSSKVISLFDRFMKLWQNRMPGGGPDRMAATLMMEISRPSGGSVPTPQKVHLIRLGLGVGGTSATGEQFTWSRGPASFTGGDPNDEAGAVREGFLLIRPAGWTSPSKIELAAWKGPLWTGDQVSYEAIVEFSDNLLLRSGRQSLATVW